MGARGNNEKTYACYEEISNLRVDVDAPPVAIYKRLDSELSKDIEDRTYQIIIPIPNNKNGLFPPGIFFPGNIFFKLS